MGTTGTIRSFDDLGRIVIPREIRRQLEIKENQPMEITVGEGGQIILRKHVPEEES